MDGEHLRREAEYNDRAWPWHFYRPFVGLALEYGLPLAAANLSRGDAARVVREGLDILGEPLLRELGLHQPLPEVSRARMQGAIIEGHCSKVPSDYLEGMVDAQRARDAVMAAALVKHVGRGALLIAGNGHVRRDSGVPLHLARRMPGSRAVSVAFIEVIAQKIRPGTYVLEDDPEFDFLWFTVRQERSDPCVGLRLGPS